METASQPTTPEGLSSFVDRVCCHKTLVIGRVGHSMKGPTLMSINVHSFTSGVEMDGSCQRARWQSQLSGLMATTHRPNGYQQSQTAVFRPRASPRDRVLICLNAP